MNSENGNSPAGRRRSQVVLIRCDGAPDIGLGHVVRCIALADVLKNSEGCDVRFLTRRGEIALRMIQQAGFKVIQPREPAENDVPWISREIVEQGADALVLDFRDQLSPGAVREWRARGLLTATIDDPEEKRIACDLFFSPPVPQVRRANWDGFTGELLVGWEWVLLRKQFAEVRSGERGARNQQPPVILVTMGGSDPAGLTLKAMQALESLDEEFRTIVIVGGAFCHNEALEKFLGTARRRFEIRRAVSNMAEVMAEADFAVASFCVTAYELATVGVPGIYLCLSEDHAEAAQAFVEVEIGVSLGVHTKVSKEQIVSHARLFLQDERGREQMAARSRALMDGRGAERIARRIAEEAQLRKGTVNVTLR